MSDKTPPTIDVIMPTYNSLPWLKSAIDSVLSQTYKNLKLYVVDDGSTDDTPQYINSLPDKRVIYIRKDNGGVSSARNLGIKHSGSPFTAFIDADDVWYPTKLEKQMALLQKYPKVGMVYGHLYVIDDEDVIQFNLRIWKRGHLFNDLCAGNVIAGSASMVLVRRDILDRAGLFHEDFINGEDWELWMRISKLCEIDFVPEILAAIRQHPSSAQINKKKMADALVHAFEVMVNEHPFNKDQRTLVASYCLFNAATTYYAIGERRLARKTLLALFRENHQALYDLENWKWRFAAGINTKIMFGNIVFDFIGKIFRRLKRLVGKSLRFPLRVIRYGRRKLKQLR